MRDGALEVDEVAVDVGDDVLINIRGALDKPVRPVGLSVVGVANCGNKPAGLD